MAVTKTNRNNKYSHPLNNDDMSIVVLRYTGRVKVLYEEFFNEAPITLPLKSPSQMEAKSLFEQPSGLGSDVAIWEQTYRRQSVACCHN